MSDVERVRLFVAADVPSDRLETLAADVRDLREELGGARWIEPANQHVTLKFLGGTTSDRLEEIVTLCAMVAASRPPSSVSLEGLGAFPNERRARVLWAGIRDEAGLMAGLAKDLDQAFEPLGFAAEARAYTPHLTLARLKVPRKLPDLPSVSTEAREPFDLGEIILFRSRLSPKGARYEALKRFALEGRS